MHDVAAVDGGGAGDVEALPAPPVANAEPAVACVFKITMLPGDLPRHGILLPLANIGAVAVGDTVKLEEFAAVGGANAIVRVIAAEIVGQRVDVPVLKRAAGVGVLMNVGTVFRAGVGYFQHLAAVAVHDDVAPVDDRLDVVAPGYVDQSFGPLVGGGSVSGRT